ncbi:(3S)-malyl-CoA thioesterase [Variovorax sp. PBL-H6]|uniref:HpcH/HpaI aldolase/citrate lyase family protein n=1 Tax=Variovorax sp. PBL-H6 TaxID=434009 RepID=UPI001318EA93|nr:CoA ester lyase [Variovorax sp. PBL-H6]VTU18909.1 (3S)-malyl-CoA thioesterase [Variovorax sp. PBL-H6]
MSSSSEAQAGRVARSLLFVPGDRPERFAKAAMSGAHAVILDLEDAVAPAGKSGARDAVARWLEGGQTRAIVRINAADTAWHEDDLAMLASVPGAGVMLPKAEAHTLARTAGVLRGRPIVALVETVAGYLGLRALAAVAGVARLAFGSVDFAVESGIVDEGDAMTAIRTQIALESCHAGLPAPVDGVSLELGDAEAMRAHALRSRQLGFGGKLCIHPRQVAVVNAAFEPTPAELQWALRVLDAFRASRGAATVVDGKMVDKPVVERARRIVDGVQAAGAA